MPTGLSLGNRGYTVSMTLLFSQVDHTMMHMGENEEASPLRYNIHQEMFGRVAQKRGVRRGRAQSEEAFNAEHEASSGI